MIRMRHVRSEDHHVAGYPYEFEASFPTGDLATVPKEVLAWCTEQFGKGKSANFTQYSPWGTHPTHQHAFCDFRKHCAKFRWIEGAESVWFQDEDDAFAFKIRWC